MSEGKVAAQVAHAVKNLGPTPQDCSIVVLKVSDKKFEEMTTEHDCYIQIDAGHTEVRPNTPTAAAWVTTNKNTTMCIPPKANELRLYDHNKKCEMNLIGLQFTVEGKLTRVEAMEIGHTDAFKDGWYIYEGDDLMEITIIGTIEYNSHRWPSLF